MLNGVLILMASCSAKRDLQPSTLKETVYALQDASIVLCLWSIYAYCALMPSFRAGVCETARHLLASIKRMSCRGNREVLEGSVRN